MVTLEERIVRFCAPVLTGIKTGGLFNTCELDPHTICQDTVAVRKRLSRFGINVRLFSPEKDAARLCLSSRRARP